MSQTGWSVNELIAEVRNPSGIYRDCFLANELGKHAELGDKDAIRELIDLLGRPDDYVKYAAYGWLKQLKSEDAETVATLGVFESDPANERVLAAWKSGRVSTPTNEEKSIRSDRNVN